MLHKEDDSIRQIRERAYLLADSGIHDGWRSVESALIGEGWPNIRSVLESEFLRRSIDDRCASARARTAVA
jgi:hypothetical protein